MLQNSIGKKVRITYIVGVNCYKAVEGIYTGKDMYDFHLIDDKIAIQTKYIISIELI